MSLFLKRYEMDRDKVFIRGAFFLLFDFKKTAAEAPQMLSYAYGELAPPERTCREWFQKW